MADLAEPEGHPGRYESAFSSKFGNHPDHANGVATTPQTAGVPVMAAKPDQLRRQTLPIPDRVEPHLTTYDAKDPDGAFPPIEQLRPPTGAPNVLVVLIDDCGFGASSAFGGPIDTPNFERLASNGLKYNRFHTTALCSP